MHASRAPPGREHAGDLAAIALVEEDDRMDVAVAGMKDVADPELVALGGRRDAAEDLRHARPRDDAVLGAVVRCEAADRPEGALPALPEQGALGVVPSDADLLGAVPATDARDALHLVVEARRRSVELDQEDGAGLGRKPGVERLLDGAEDQAIHHLERSGDDAGGDHAGDRLARGRDRRKDGEERAVGLGLPDETECRPGDDAEGSLGTDGDADEIVAGPILHRAAERHDLPRGQHELDREHVVRRDAVLQGVRPPGVLGDVAADRAGRLARWVGREEEAIALDRARDPEVHDACLCGDAAVAHVDQLDLLETARPDDDRRPDRKGSTREAGAGSARHECDALLGEESHHRAHLGRAPREHHDLGGRALEGVAVAFVGEERFAPADEASRPDDLPETPLEPVAQHATLLARLVPPFTSRRFPAADMG
jgi:hypothetical protein